MGNPPSLWTKWETAFLLFPLHPQWHPPPTRTTVSCRDHGRVTEPPSHHHAATLDKNGTTDLVSENSPRPLPHSPAHGTSNAGLPLLLMPLHTPLPNPNRGRAAAAIVGLSAACC